MMRERRNTDRNFLALLERLAEDNLGEETSLEQLLKASHENPERFEEEWLWPLLAEGIAPGQAFELIVEGTLRPN